MSRRGGGRVSYVEQEEPAFLKRFKERIGYKEEPGLEAKYEQEGSEADPVSKRYDNNDDDDDDDRLEDDEEKPQVVVIKKNHLTAEQAEKHAAQLQKIKDETPANLDERVVFKKPVKRSTEEEASSSSSSSGAKKVKTSKTVENSAANKIKNKKLLSFDNVDDDEEG